MRRNLALTPESLASCEDAHERRSRHDLEPPLWLTLRPLPDVDPEWISLMTTTRHRAAARLAARFGKLSRPALVASTVTAAAVAVGVTVTASAPDVTKDQTVSLGSPSAALDEVNLAERREQRISRSATRLAPPVALEPKATDHKFATALLNIWLEPREGGKRLGLLKWGTKVAVTGQVVGHWAEVLLPDGNRQVVRWVNAHYLANSKPKPEESSSGSGESTDGPTVGGSCSNGTTVPAGVSSNIAAIHQAVCSNWPQITTYGTLRADTGDHGSGRAIDIMISGSEAWEVAEFLRAGYSSFGISYIIHAQKIWSVDRAGEGWRYMEDRGSITANHYDHVHVSVY